MEYFKAYKHYFNKSKLERADDGVDSKNFASVIH